MIPRLWRDEAGVALGLAVILVALLGVMAAGFLALLRGDLEAAISSNHGQRAFTAADAGAQAAVGQLRSDADPGHYDARATDNARWSYVSPDGGAPGKVLTLGDGSARVTVRYLIPATEEGQQAEEDHAPEPVPEGTTDYPEKDFFLVVSEGVYGGARRKVEVIVYATDPGEVERWSWREAYE